MLQNMSGTEMDYETFKAEFDQLPQLKNIVQQFDGRGITLKTKEKPEPTATDKSNAAPSAKRAAAKTLQQPG